METSWAPAAGSGGLAPATDLMGRWLAALRQGDYNQAKVLAETLEADEKCRASAQISAKLMGSLEAELQQSQAELAKQKLEHQKLEAMLENKAASSVSQSFEAQELKPLLASLAEQKAAGRNLEELLQQARLDVAGLRECEEASRSKIMASIDSAFHHFVDGVPADQLGDSMRILGMNPTENEDFWRHLARFRFFPWQKTDSAAQSLCDEVKNHLQRLGRPNYIEHAVFHKLMQEELDKHLAKDQVQELVDCLKHFDRDGKGALTLEEFQRAMKGSDFSSEDLETNLAKLKNSEGHLDFMVLAEHLLGPYDHMQISQAKADVARQLSSVKTPEGQQKNLLELAVLQGANDEELKMLLDDMQQKAGSAEAQERLLEGLVDLGCMAANRKAEAKRQAEQLASDKTPEGLPDTESQEKSPDEEVQTYDLNDRRAFAQFLLDADIRLVRGVALKKWHQNGMKLPRRQEAEAMMVGTLLPALVSREEIELWAKGVGEAEEQLDELEQKVATADIVAVSHVWEAREHPDPHGYQLKKLAQKVDSGAWFFLDYVSLFQFRRSTRDQDHSFRKAMQNMHVLYAHEHTSTLRIESLTPSDQVSLDAEVLVYHAPSGEVRPVAVRDLMLNGKAYAARGWCVAEHQWSATRSGASKSREVDQVEAEVAGQAPMPPEVFRPLFSNKLAFTHRSDQDAVMELQERVFREKAQKNETLKLTKLSKDECEVAVKALWHYPKLRRLEIASSDLGDPESFLSSLFEALRDKQFVEDVYLTSNNLREKDVAGLLKAVQMRRDQGPLKIHLEGNDFGSGAFALALASKAGQVTLVHPWIDLLAKRMEVPKDAFAVVQAVLVREETTPVKVPLESTDFGAGAFGLAAASKVGQVPFTLIHPWVDTMEVELDEAVADERTELSTLEKLRGITLQLASKRLGDGDCANLGNGLCALRGLQRLRSITLNLRENSVGNAGCKALADSVAQLSHLTQLSLDLCRNSVGPEGCKALADSVAQLSQVTHLSLNLGENSVDVEGCKALADSVAQLSHLTHLSLDLTGNRVGDEGCQALAGSVAQMSHLTHLSLDLGGNSVGPEGCQALAAALAGLKQLAELRLKLHGIYGIDLHNGIADRAVMALVAALAEPLRRLDLTLDSRSSTCRELGAALARLQLQRLRLKVGVPGGEEVAVRAALREQLQQVPDLELKVW